MILPASYANGFAPRDGQPLYPELWRGCVGAWNPGLGPTGLTLRDWSGFGRHGTLTNMVAGDDWLVRQGRYALDFDGTNDYLSMPCAPIGANNYTVSVFFQQVTGATSLDIAAPSNPITTSTTGYNFPRIAIRELNIQISRDARGAYTASATGDNAWHHLALVRRSGSVEIYLDGRQLALSTSGTDFDQSGYSFSGSVFFVARINLTFLPLDFYTAGRVDDFRVYLAALSPNEIRLLATRPGIAYELAPRKRSRISLAGFQPYWLARKTQIIGGGL